MKPFDIDQNAQDVCGATAKANHVDAVLLLWPWLFLQRIKLSVIKSEEERLMMENKARDAELMVTRLVEEAERRREEADVLKKEVDNAR